jgi:hypothetical protein
MSEKTPEPDIAAIAREYGQMLGGGMDPELADKEIRRRYPSLEGNSDWEVMKLTAFKPMRSVAAIAAGGQLASDVNETRRGFQRRRLNSNGFRFKIR